MKVSNFWQSVKKFVDPFPKFAKVVQQRQTTWGEKVIKSKAEREWMTVAEALAQFPKEFDVTEQMFRRWIRLSMLEVRDVRRAGANRPEYRINRAVVARAVENVKSGLPVNA